MLDINLIRENPEAVRTALLKRMDAVDFGPLLEQDAEHRAVITEVEALQATRNRVSRDIPRMKKAGEDASAAMAEMKDVSRRIGELEARRARLAAGINEILWGLPNVPADDVPAGGKENNEVLRTWGEAPSFAFEPRDHVALVEALGLVDYKRGARMGGSGYWLYRGDGARLEWALLNYFIDAHLADGYEFMLPPHILTYDCGFTAGQFPKFIDDVFHLKPDGDGGEDRDLFLLPTAETALINFHRGEILAEQDLPRKYFAYTPCYRKEAGSYRTSERGMIRGHQFNKVEMFQYTRPEDSAAALDELVGKAEALVQGLGLHHRVTKLAACDCSASMAKTYDIEVWIPSMQEYKEVSSASNAGDYQARRGRIRFRRRDSKKTEYIHTLNASGLATSRLLPAIVEQFQLPDGRVRVPDVLQARVGRDVLEGAS
jgi:seryl-tRNA synthetase